jgi:dolichol-phosphate mannosyltransferase
MKISVILPTRNEPLINELVDEIHTVLKNKKHEIIIIDKSDTPPKIKNAKLFLQESKGLGNAVLEGIQKSKGDLIVVMDSDFAHDPKDIPRLLEKIKDYDIVIGSRYAKGAESHDSFIRKTVSRFYCLLSNIILGLEFKDTMNGFAVVKRKVYDSIQLNPLGYKIHTETFYKAKQKGFKICEVPIIFHKRRAGKSNTNIKEAIRTLIFIFQLRFKLR